MSKQDRQGVRSATDLEQKYNFGKSFAEVMGLAKDAQGIANEAKDAANKLDKSLSSDEIFNRLTENGAIQGLYKEDGNIYINASYIKSGELHTIASKVYQASDYTSNDLDVIERIMAGTITATEAHMEKYDLNGDGAITVVDHTNVKNLVNGAFSWYRFTWYAELNPTKRDSVLRIYYSIDRSDGYSTKVDTLNVNARYVNEMVLPTANDGLPATVAVDWTGKVYTVSGFPIEMDGSYCMYRTLDDGTVEWITPPMVANVEYRTTERFANRPVYVYFMTHSYHSASVTAIPHNISGIYAPVSIDIINNEQELLTHSSSVKNLTFNRTNIGIQTDGDLDNVWFILKYTK